MVEGRGSSGGGEWRRLVQGQFRVGRRRAASSRPRLERPAGICTMRVCMCLKIGCVRCVCLCVVQAIRGEARCRYRLMGLGIAILRLRVAICWYLPRACILPCMWMHPHYYYSTVHTV